MFFAKKAIKAVYKDKKEEIMTKFKLLVIFVPLIFFLGCSTLSSKSGTKEKNQKKAKGLTKAAQNASIDFGSIQCKLKKDIRTVSVNKTDSGCVVNYTKLDETREIASAKNDYSHCQAVKDKVITNLTEGGFSCGE